METRSRWPSQWLTQRLTQWLSQRVGSWVGAVRTWFGSTVYVWYWFRVYETKTYSPLSFLCRFLSHSSTSRMLYGLPVLEPWSSSGMTHSFRGRKCLPKAPSNWSSPTFRAELCSERRYLVLLGEELSSTPILISSWFCSSWTEDLTARGFWLAWAYAERDFGQSKTTHPLFILFHISRHLRITEISVSDGGILSSWISVPVHFGE